MSKKIVSVSMDEDALEELDEKRGGLKRSHIINELVKRYNNDEVDVN